jgi:hypothetical protein
VEVTHFSEIEAEFLQRVQTMVWCNVATIDWQLFKTTPPPLGFDPAPDFISPDHENFGVLKLTPWRIVLVSFPAESFEKGTLLWRNRGSLG